MAGTKKSNIPLGLAIRYVLARYLLYPIVYYIIRYRRRVVRQNLCLSFPEYTSQQVLDTEKQFYQYLCSMVAEVCYGSHLSVEEFEQFVQVKHLDLLLQYSKAAGGSILMMSHLGNWEWFASIANRMHVQGVEAAITYRKQKNPWIDRLMYRLRSRSGGVLIEKNRLLREVIRLRQCSSVMSYVLIADQKPRPEVTHVTTPFFHRSTGFLDGGEVLARKFNYPVFYAYATLLAPGRYEIDFRLITDQPQTTEPSAITCAYARLVEENIRQNPSLWLWSHNRWKWSK